VAAGGFEGGMPNRDKESSAGCDPSVFGWGPSSEVAWAAATISAKTGPGGGEFSAGGGFAEVAGGTVFGEALSDVSEGGGCVFQV